MYQGNVIISLSGTKCEVNNPSLRFCYLKQPVTHQNRIPAAKATWILVANLQHTSGLPLIEWVDALEDAVPKLDIGSKLLVENVTHYVWLATRRHIQSRDQSFLKSLLHGVGSVCDDNERGLSTEIITWGMISL